MMAGPFWNQWNDIRAARGQLPDSHPGQGPLSDSERYWYTRALMNESDPLQKAQGAIMPLLAAGEQAVKGGVGLVGGQMGRSGFYPAGILGAARGLFHGIRDNFAG